MDSLYKKLLTYSYNIVGSYEDAKDLVQDALEKYVGVDESTVLNKENYLTRSVINHSLNFKKQICRQSKYGVWLPEPVPTETPDAGLIKENVARYSLLVLMEKLTPRERAVFILKEAFDYSHEEIAGLLNISTYNSRKLLSRSKKALHQPAMRHAIHNRKIVASYIEAITSGNVKELEKLLTEDVKVYADGGSKVKVIGESVTGRTATVQLLLLVYNQYQSNYTCRIHFFNHEPAVCFFDKHKMVICQILHIRENKVAGLYAILDVAKLPLITR
ncbi:sigma factor-like helix-turn-helix DNA-binding protein [Niastella caeni]|nr:sigma factor-like helix-turn-helix DNA-binding protein [Niastella caeni]